MQIHGQDYEIEVVVKLPFTGWHALPVRPELHEHRWEAEFVVSGPLNPQTGMVCDMLHLAEIFKPLIDELDGKNLHEVKGFQAGEGLVTLAATYPTCDTLAHYLMWRALPLFQENPQLAGLKLARIRISIFEPDDAESWGSAVIRPKHAH